MRKIFFVFAFMVALWLMAAPAQAEIKLTPRVGNIGGESYVLFGKFQHRLVEWNGTKEEAKPVLWRVMEADGAGKATLLSHFLVDAMAYNTNDAQAPYNKWGGSTVQTWLNNDFLSDFSAREQTAMLGVPAGATDDVQGAKVTLPSIDEIETTWFSTNDSRKAHFRGAFFTYDDTNNGWSYWLRSPANDTYGAASVLNDGSLVNGDGSNVQFAFVGVRPAFYLNRQSFIFKSGSVFSPSASEAGKVSNPYFLYLGTIPPEDLSSQITATVNGDKLTLSFAQNIFHAFKDIEGDLSGAFTLSGGKTVDTVEFQQQSIVLTLDSPYAHGDTVTIAYTGDTADADGIGFLNNEIPTTLKAFSNQAVANVTPETNRKRGGGCNAGLGMLGALVMLAVYIGRRKRG